MNEVEAFENLKSEPQSNWGGSRPGAGRKPRLQYEVRDLFNFAIDEEWDNILKVVRYHVRKGDKDVTKWLIEQRIGKAPQTLDVTAKAAILSVTSEISDDSPIDIMEIAKKVSAELKLLKTSAQ